MRAVVVALGLGFIALLAVLTVYVLVASGPDVLVVTSLVVLAVLALGVAGALGTPPRD